VGSGDGRQPGPAAPTSAGNSFRPAAAGCPKLTSQQTTYRTEVPSVPGLATENAGVTMVPIAGTSSLGASGAQGMLLVRVGARWCSSATQ
jgi:hypothetical protein